MENSREKTREQIRDTQRSGKRRHSESAVTFASTHHDTTVPPPRKQGARISSENNEYDDNDIVDLNDSSNDHPAYSRDDELRDSDKISSLTTKLYR